MTPDTFTAIVQQFSLLNGLLAAFCVAAALQLVAMRDERPLTTVIVGVFLIAALALLVSIGSYMRVVVALLRDPDFSRAALFRLATGLVGQLARASAEVGIIGFFVGIGLLGWLQSRRLGLVTSVSVVIAYVIVAVLQRL